MPYSTSKNAKGRWEVISPKGKTWKTTFPTDEKAQEAIAKLKARIAGFSSGETGTSRGEMDPDVEKRAEKVLAKWHSHDEGF